MHAMRRTLVAVVLVLAACGTGSTQGPTPHEATASGTGAGSGTGSGTDSGMICHEETPTGSSIPRQVCRTPEESERAHKDAEDLARSRGLAPPSHQ